MEILTILALALALGTDSFSVCLGIGTTRVSLNGILRISTVIGIFHVFMPLAGIMLGDLLGRLAGDIAGLVGAMILILIGAKIIWESIKGDNEKANVNYTSLVGILILATGVSLDALTIGFSLGALGMPLTISVIFFGVVAFLMSCLGLILGRQLSTLIGQRAEIAGGIILIALGLFAIFRG